MMAFKQSNHTMKSYPAQAEIIARFEYRDGLLYYRVAPLARKRQGDVAGSIDLSTGYRIVKIGGVRYKAHRLVWVYVHGVLPPHVIDHINGDRTDNRIENLRGVTQAVNMQNQIKPTAANKTGSLGVYWSERLAGFMAAVSVSGKKRRRGPYRTVERAAQAYLELKRAHHEGCAL